MIHKVLFLLILIICGFQRAKLAKIQTCRKSVKFFCVSIVVFRTTLGSTNLCNIKLISNFAPSNLNSRKRKNKLVQIGDYRMFPQNGLKGQQAVSPGQRPGYDDRVIVALKGQKPWTEAMPPTHSFAPTGRGLCTHAYPGRCPGLTVLCPFGAWSSTHNRTDLFFIIT